MRFKSIYVEQIPIPKASTEQKQKISNLVQKCLDAKGKNVADFEIDIDKLVAQLYGLTEEDVQIIRRQP